MNLHTELLTLSASLPRGHRDSYFPEISHFWDVRRRLGRASYAVDERNEVDGRYDVTDIVCVDMLVIDFQSSCTLTLLGTQWTCSRICPAENAMNAQSYSASRVVRINGLMSVSSLAS